MNREQILQWGASLHYPRIVLDRESRDTLAPGERAWRALLESNDPARVARLAARRDHWRERSRR